MAVSPIDLTTIAAVKAMLGPPDPSADALLQTLVTACSRYITKACGRTQFQSQVYIKVWNGDNTYGLSLPNGPITSVSSVTIDGNDVPPFEAGSGDAGFILQNGRVELVGWIFGAGIANVQITYEGGYDSDSLPEDLVQAATDFVCWEFRNRDHFGIAGKTIVSSEALTYRQDVLPFLTQTVIDQYRSYQGVSLD